MNSVWKEFVLVLFLVFRWAFIVKIRLRENASDWWVPKFDSRELEDRSLAPTLMHIACMDFMPEQFNSWIWAKLRRCTNWRHGSVHSSTLVYFKRNAFTWNFQGEGHLSAPDLGLASSNLPCDLRMRARTFTEISVSGWLAPSCASWPASALRCSSSAWRLEVTPLRHYKLAT